MGEIDALLTPSAPSAAPRPDTTGPAIFNRVKQGAYGFAVSGYISAGQSSSPLKKSTIC